MPGSASGPAPDQDASSARVPGGRRPAAIGWSLLIGLAALWMSAHVSAAPRPPQSLEPPDGQRAAPTLPEPVRRAPIDELPLLVSVAYPEARIGFDRLPHALPQLVEFIHTRTRAGVLLRAADLALGDPRAHDPLLLYLTGNNAALRFTEAQKRWLGEYLRDGGLLFAEDLVPLRYGESYVQGAGQPGTVFDLQVRALTRDPAVLGQDGDAWRPLPDDHPLFTAFFPFVGAPPPAGTDPTEIVYLEMLEWRGRVAVILSELNVSWAWAHPDAPGRTRGLEFGTNLVVFALAQRRAGPALQPPREKPP